MGEYGHNLETRQGFNEQIDRDAQTLERLSILSPHLRAMRFRLTPVTPSEEVNGPTFPAFLQGEEVGAYLMNNMGFQNLTGPLPSDINLKQQISDNKMLGHLVTDIEQADETGLLEMSEKELLYPHRKEFSIDPDARYPDQICPIIDQKLLKNYPLPESFSIVHSDLSPAKIWIVPENGNKDTIKYPLEVSIKAYENAYDEITKTRWIKYAYYVSYFAGDTFYGVVPGISVNQVNRLNRQDVPEKPDQSYFFVDEQDQGLPPTHDVLQKERLDYPQETIEFRTLMLEADYFVRGMLSKNNIGDVANLTESIRRMERKDGRVNVRQALGELRSLLKPFILQNPRDVSYVEPESAVLADFIQTSKSPLLHNLIRDLNYDLSECVNLGVRKKMDAPQIAETLLKLFNIESTYLGPVWNYPWNNIGPEPFDALIEVLWFRYDFREIENRFKHFNRMINNAVGKAIIDGWRRFQQDTGTKPNIKDADPMELTERKLEVNKMMARPLGLTKLLWSTLKWAQPRMGKSGSISGTRRYDPELWDESLLDPNLPQQGDYQNRIVLAGEDRASFSHLGHEAVNHQNLQEELKIRLLRAAESLGISVSLRQIEEIVKDEFSQDAIEHIPAKEVAIEFRDATKNLDLEQILKKVRTYPYPIRLLIYSRLGYMHPQLKKDGMSGSVQQFINIYFQGNSAKYYRCLRSSGTLLKKDHTDEESEEIITKLRKETSEIHKGLTQRNAYQETSVDDISIVGEDLTGGQSPETIEEDFQAYEGIDDKNNEEVPF
jgi:hypothetical protein